jgi:nucleotide-binding universal stress UspA family protein
MNTQTSTSPLDAIRGVLALRCETYALEHKFEYWAWALLVSSAALICQIHGLVTLTRLAFKTGASLSVVYVYEPIPLGEYVCESTFTILEEERDRLCKLLGELAQKVKPSGLMCKAVFLVGDPAEQIAKWARKDNADLIITGSNEATFLGRLFNLAKAPRIMHRAPCLF